MGMLFATLQISNPLKEENEKANIRCVVNRSLFTNLIITQQVAKDLGFKEVEKRHIKIGHGPTETYSYVGPIQLEFKGRIGFMGALINNDENAISCYLGSIVMDEMGLIVISKSGLGLIINPNPAVLA